MNSIYANTIYTGKTVEQEAYLVFDKNKIIGVSKEKKGTLLGEFPVLTPAFIDPHSHIGMVRAGEPSEDDESNETLESIIANADALDSVLMDDRAFTEAIEMGVLYSCVVPGSGNIIAGLSAIIRHYAKNSSDALIGRAGIKSAFGYNTLSAQDWKGQRPCTRMGAMSILRTKLDEVQEKNEKYKTAKGKDKKDITFSAEEVVLRDLLEQKNYLRAHVHKIDDIASILRVVDEFKLKITIEHGLAIHQPEILIELKKRKIKVVFGPTDSFAYKVELKDESWRNIQHLIDTKVDYGLMTDHPVVQSGSLFLQTRWFTRTGLTKQQAIELISRKNAEVIGINNILGTLEKNKWASFICWNGDPFDITKFPVKVYGEGKLLFENS